MNCAPSKLFRFGMPLCLLLLLLNSVYHNAVAAETFKFLAPKYTAGMPTHLAYGWNANPFGSGVKPPQQPRTEGGISAMVQSTSSPETYRVVLSNGFTKPNAPAAGDVVTEITRRLFK